MTLFLRNHAILHLLWLSYQIWIRYMTLVFFSCEELNNVYDNHKIIRVALLVLTLIENNFCNVLAFDSMRALNIQVKRER